jgi:hypothetical protein
MDQPVCKLTLAYPPASETHIVELLLNCDPPLNGFTTFAAEGHGHSFGKASMRERVRGRIARGILVVVLPRSRAPSLLEEIAVKAAIEDLVYWVEPVEAFGRLTRVDDFSIGSNAPVD